MRKLLCTLLCLLVFVIAGVAQDKLAVKYSKTITLKDLEKHLSILASDEYEGRETGEKGQKLAAAYISKHFKSIGLEGPVKGSYLQTFDLSESSLQTAYFRKGDEKKMLTEDFIYYSKTETSGEEYASIVYVSNTKKKSDLTGKYALFSMSESESIETYLNYAQESGAKGSIVALKEPYAFNSYRFQAARINRSRLSIDRRTNKQDILIISNTKLVEWIYGKEISKLEAHEQAQVIFNADYLDRPVFTENVLGYLEGSEKPDELIIVTAHYDHIGIINGEVNNGADDDGSGTVAVLEIAEAFAEAAKKGDGPKRSMLFMTVSGEEKGLLGSRYYTDYEPVFPLENTITNLNIDMIGRVDKRHEENPDYIYLIGSDKLSQDLHELSEEMNSRYTNLELDYTYNDENDPNRFYYRSDHYNFAKNNIPIIFYFNGTHADYHKPTDTIEKINFDKMLKITKLVFHTAWEVANRVEKIEVD